MFDALVSFSLSRRWIVFAAALLVAAAGVWSFSRLRIDAFPDTTPVQVQINTVAPALVPDEVERQITFPVELAMNGMPGVVQLRSVSQSGLSNVIVTFKDGTSIYFARQLVNERLGLVELPPGVPRPEMGPVATGLGEVFQFILVSQDKSPTELRTILDWTVKPVMRAVPGVAEINSWGGLKKQFQVRIDPGRLMRYDLSFEEVIAAVERNNVNVGGGNISEGGDNLLVHGVGRTINVTQIENMVILAKEGVPIRICDVGEVTIGHELRRGAVSAKGKGEAVLGIGFILMGENSYAVTDRIRTAFETLGEIMPEGVSAVKLYDRTVLVNRVIETVRKNLLEGGYLVVVILYLFIGNLRAGLITATAIPLSMLFAFCGMLPAGIAGSLLSLGAIDFGIVVDSSVVVIENIMAKLSHAGPLAGARRMEIIRQAVGEVRAPAVFGQLIIMIVYLPILTLEGVEGKMFRPMAMTVVFVLTGSLIIAVTLTPALASVLLPKTIAEHDVLLVRLARRVYRPMLSAALTFRWPIVGTAVALLAVAFVVASRLGTEFVPRLYEGDVVIGIARPAGTSLEESVRVNTRMEQILLNKFPDEVSHLWSRVGTAEVATDAGSLDVTDMFVSLKPREVWTKAKTQAELVELMHVEVGDIPGQTIWLTQPIELRINEMISGVRSDIALKLFGEDFERLIPKARELEQVLRDVPGCVDLSTEQVLGQPVLRVVLSQDQIARYGVSAEAVLDLVKSLGGIELGEIVEGQLRFPLVVRLPETFRENRQMLSTIMMRGPQGEQIPLSRLADIREVEGPKMISRDWGKRRVTIQCNVRGRDVGSFVKEAQSRIASKVDLPKDVYRVEWGGQFENMSRAQERLLIVVPLAMLLIVALLFMSFRNVRDTLFVFTGVPFACVGGIVALALREMPLSITAAIGFITLSGVSVLNNMVLVTRLRSLIGEDLSGREAIVAASMASLRTVLMTALIASVGFIPMATSQGSGAEVQRPLATVVIGGVISSTMMTLLILPVVYSFSSLRRRRPPTPSDVAVEMAAP